MWRDLGPRWEWGQGRQRTGYEASRRSVLKGRRCPVSRYVVVMVDPAPVEKATNLFVDERLQLIANVWDSIGHSTRLVSPAVAAVVEELVADAEANPLDGRSWEGVRQSLRERHSG